MFFSGCRSALRRGSLQQLAAHGTQLLSRPPAFGLVDHDLLLRCSRSLMTYPALRHAEKKAAAAPADAKAKKGPAKTAATPAAAAAGGKAPDAGAGVPLDPEEAKKIKKDYRPKPHPRRMPNLYMLVDTLPQAPPPPDPKPFGWATTVHKNGLGLNFSRSLWRRYPEPCYWTITKFRPSVDGRRAKAWGILTFRGVTEPKAREIRCSFKREWYLLSDEELKTRTENMKLLQQQAALAAAAAAAGASSPVQTEFAQQPATAAH